MFLFRKKSKKIQFNQPTEIPDILNEEKADEIVAEIIAQQKA